MIALVQDWWRQYGAWVDVDMFAVLGKDLITFQPVHAKFNDVPQRLLDHNLRDLPPLSCQVLVWKWCGPHHVRALHCELYWFLAVCPRCYPWGALAETKYDFSTILNTLLRHLRSLVGDTRVRFVHYDAGS